MPPTKTEEGTTQFTGMTKLDVEIVGTVPLGMHHSRLANPLDPCAIRLKEAVRASKVKGADPYAAASEISDAEFVGGIYHDPRIGPYVESRAIVACMTEAAKLTRRGRDVARGVNVVPARIPVIYDGPRDVEGMMADPRFRDIRIVSLDPSKGQKSPKGPRTRPCFPEWTLRFSIIYVPAMVDPVAIVAFLRDAGIYEGLLDGRGKLKWGRFKLTKVAGDPKAVQAWTRDVKPYLDDL